MFKKVIRRTLKGLLGGDAEKRNSSSLSKPPPWLMINSGSGVTVSENTTLSVAAFYRAVSLVGNIIGSMPASIVEVKKDGSLLPRPYHPLSSLINLQPHPYYTKADFMMAMIVQLMLRQNFVAHIRRDRYTGRPLNLRIIEWREVYDIVEDEEEEQLYYKIEGKGMIPGRDILHVKGVTREGISGEDTLLRHRDTLGSDLAAREQVNKMYRNGTRLSGYVSSDQHISESAMEQYSRWWDMNYSGPENTGATPFLGGGLKYHPIEISPADAQTLETRQFNIYDISRVTGVPPEFLFAMGTNNVLRLEDLSGLLMRFTISPLVERIEQEFNRKLFSPREFGRVVVQMDMEYYLRADAASRAKLYETLFKIQSMSPNEIRRKEGMNPRKGGNEYGLPFASNVSGADQKQQSSEGENTGDQANQTQPANGEE